MDSETVLGFRGPEGRTPKVKPYNFYTPDKFSREQIRTVESLQASAARLLSTSLTAALRTKVEVGAPRVDQMTWQEYLDGGAPPRVYAVGSLRPHGGSFVVDMPLNAAEALLERRFGGQEGAREGTQLSALQYEALKDLISRKILPSFDSSWSVLFPASLRSGLEALEGQSQFVQIVPPTEMVICVSHTLTLGGFQSSLSWALPYLTLEPVMERLSPQFWYSQLVNDTNPPTPQRRALARNLPFSSRVAVEAEPLSLRTLGALKKGTLIRIPLENFDRGGLMMGEKVLVELEVTPPLGGRLKVKTKTPRSPGLSREGAEAWASLQGEIQKLREKIQTMEDAGKSKATPPARTNAGETPPADPFLLSSLRLPQEAEVISFVLQEEPDQVAAWVLSQMSSPLAGQTLSHLEPKRQGEIARRLAVLEETDEALLGVLAPFFASQLASFHKENHQRQGGLSLLADILSQGPRSLEKTVVEQLQNTAPELAQGLMDSLFVFEDLAQLDPVSLKWILGQLEVPLLCKALKAAKEELRGSFLKALEPAQAQQLQQCLQSLGPVRLSEVEAAQKMILDSVKAWEAEGQVFIPRRDEVVD